MALNRSLFNSPFLTINTSRFFRLSAFPSLISSDFSLLRVRKNDSASEFAHLRGAGDCRWKHSRNARRIIKLETQTEKN
ncbi:hypothetical protein SDJN03_16448, partial [Cucurbita argyrosperma subsp. sororia]